MTVPTPLPEPSQSPNWAAQLNAAITDRYEDAKQAAAEAADTINNGRLSEDALKSTIDTRVSDGLGDLDGADTGATGLAVLAAALPADAREALDITVDTTVGTRVMVGGVMVYGDTGWRTVDWLPPEGITVQESVARREGTTVTFAGAFTVSEAGTTSRPAVIPSGFRPIQEANSFAAQVVDVGGTFKAGLQINRSGTTYLHNKSTAGAAARFLVKWETTDPWPTSLPGAPA